MAAAKLNGCVAAAVAAAMLAGPAMADPIADLPGRWSGFGSITLANGSSEQMRCVATYFVEGAELKQNLRCASADYKIDAVVKLTVADGQVSGNWEERTWSTTGSITGRMSSAGFDLAINGPGFTAGLRLDTTSCKQSIAITPRGTDVSNISMTLGKC